MEQTLQWPTYLIISFFKKMLWAHLPFGTSSTFRSYKNLCYKQKMLLRDSNPGPTAPLKATPQMWTFLLCADPQFKLKILRLPDDSSVETCRPNPCLNGGKCLNSAVRKTCQCSSHFTGLFCALTQCELEPCLFGICELTTTGYHCRCQAGYTGKRLCTYRKRQHGNQRWHICGI